MALPTRKDTAAMTLSTAWRYRADQLDAYARSLKRDGYTSEAQDAEQAATDYRIAADDYEMQA